MTKKFHRYDNPFRAQQAASCFQGTALKMLDLMTADESRTICKIMGRVRARAQYELARSIDEHFSDDYKKIIRRLDDALDDIV